jgi:hypothetical protein
VRAVELDHPRASVDDDDDDEGPAAESDETISGWPATASLSEDSSEVERTGVEPIGEDQTVEVGETIGDYRLEQLLGQGGAGRVFAARHLGTGAPWALKLLDCHKPAALLRFKREYRVLANVEHDNLVRLGELRVLSPTRAYLTMELIHGRPFVEWVRRGTPVGGLPNLLRLRRAMRQLTHGVERLHAEGGIHRDLKPSNVLVTEDGRVVILDFGLIRESGPVGQSLTDAGQALGTPLYMAPEQAGEGDVGPACDWYSVGVMLFECLTGLRPFVGSAMQILIAKQQQAAPDPGTMLPGLPGPLRSLCVGLLERQPQRRAGAKQLLELFGERETEASVSLRDSSIFVGRERELERMRAAIEVVRRQRQASIVRVAAAPGLGKSALIQRFIREVEHDEAALVLRCRCVERESLPFKGVDGLVDALALALRRMPPLEAAALQPRQLGPLSRIFPALADAWSSRALVPEFEPRELRRLGVAALREVLERLADRRLLLLVIDDFQWADNDSAQLLVELLRPPTPPALMLLVAHRDSAGTGEAGAGTGEARAGGALELLVRAPALTGQPSEHLELGPLSSDEAEQLARALLGGSDDARVHDLSARAQGNPQLLTQLARSELTPGFAGSSERALMGRLLELPPSGRLVLEYIAVASGPLPLPLLEQLLPVGGLERELDELSQTGLIRRDALASLRTTLVDASHERIRELIVTEMTPDELRRHHRALAEVFEARGAEPETIAEHWEHAGDGERALIWAERAAREAAEHLAFARSVAGYRRALRLLDPASGVSMTSVSGSVAVLSDLLRAELAEQLVALGNTSEAADILLALAERDTPEQACALRRRAARLRFANGRFREAMQLSAEQLTHVGELLPRTRVGALCMLLWNRAFMALRPSTEAREGSTTLAPELLARLTTLQSYVAAAFIISSQPSVQASALRARLLRLALEAGEPSHIAYSLALEARIVGWLGDTAQAKLLLDRVAALPSALAPGSDPTLVPLTRYTEASAHFGAQTWRTAHERIDELARMVDDEVPGTGWLRPHLLALRGAVRVMSGRFAELRASLTADLAVVASYDDAFNSALLVWSGAYLDLVDGNIDRAEASLAEFRAKQEMTYISRATWLTMAEADVALFRGQLPEALALSAKLIAQARQHRLDRVRLMYGYFGEQQARALAQQLLAEPTHAGARKQLRRWIRQFGRAREPLLRALAATHRALLCELDGDGAAAQHCWEAALRDYESADTPARAAAVRLRLASYATDGRALAAQAMAYFEREQLGGWRRVVELYAPSPRDLPRATA